MHKVFIIPLFISIIFLAGCKDENKKFKVLDSKEIGELPETAIYDQERQLWYISCIVGNPTAEDGNGLIYSYNTKTKSTHKLFSGLDGPKGMRIKDDKLYVADIQKVRIYNLESSSIIAILDLSEAGAIALNDLDFDDTGILYLTDPALIFNESGSEHIGIDKILRLHPDGKSDIAIKSDFLQRPNGIEWDSINKHFIILPLYGDAVFKYKPGMIFPEKIAEGKDRFDGVEIDKENNLLVSVLKPGAIYKLNSDGKYDLLIDDLIYPANFGIDKEKNQILIPFVTQNKIELIQLN